MDISKLKPADWGKHFVVRNFTDTLPTWDSVLPVLENALFNTVDNRAQSLKNLGFVVRHGHVIPEIKCIQDEVAKLRPDLVCNNHVFISLTTRAQTFPKHRDWEHTFFVQGIGKTEFAVDDGTTEHKYILNPGDLLYMPRLTYHTTRPITPRVGISIGLEDRS